MARSSIMSKSPGRDVHSIFDAEIGSVMTDFPSAHSDRWSTFMSEKTASLREKLTRFSSKMRELDWDTCERHRFC